ncbi:MAG: glycosyltransferase [Caryophanon sp.]|nr:glycosyltransferase [Caryophanon sp.]
MHQVVAVLPVYNPTDEFEEDIEEILSLQFAQIIVVNDGSNARHDALFERLRQMPNITLLSHENKRGKSAAVKTAVSYVQRHLQRCKGILLIGAYGQHKLRDIEQVLHVSRIYNDGVVLGVRSFQSRELPVSSRIGNFFVTLCFELRCKRRIADVQTALRYIAMPHVSMLQRISGEQFDLDVYMLMEAVKRRIPLYEVYIGKANIKKNTFIQYDETFRFHNVGKKIWQYKYLQ